MPADLQSPVTTAPADRLAITVSSARAAAGPGAHITGIPGDCACPCFADEEA